MVDFEDITYLKTGSDIQKRAYRTLTVHKIPERLKEYGPVLAGTVPVDIAVEGSDLDMICSWKDKVAFAQKLEGHFGNYPGFRIKNKTISGIDSVVACFEADDFKIEVFGQHIPVTKQAAYIHMIAEHALLKEKGEAFRQGVLELKRKGYKTEPAFGMLLGMRGDPYTELLAYGREIIKKKQSQKI